MSWHTHTDWLRAGTTVYALNLEGTNRFCAQVQGGWVTDGRLRTDEAEIEANARLIAAAPDLLEALIDARKQLEAYEEALNGEDYNSPRINAAIAKATGEQQ